ncbi:Cation-efflux pump FieF [Gammaproteobacteria bacterium]
MTDLNPIEANLLHQASRASVLTASVLVLVKTGAWLLTGSTSLLATLIDSTLDALASITNLVALSYAARPADQEHRFGHGKLESLAGLAQSLFITGSGLFLLQEAWKRLLHPQPLENPGIGTVVMLFSIVATFLLVRFQKKVIAVTKSVAIRADSLHYGADLLTNTAVLIALACDWLWDWEQVDPVLAIAIAFYVLYNAGEIAWESVQLLMDHELPEADRKIIMHLACSHPQVRGASNLKTRRSGNTTFVQFQLEIGGNSPLAEAHKITEEVEAQIKNSFPNAEIHIHQEPVLGQRNP